jgi:hypothetical protein
MKVYIIITYHDGGHCGETMVDQVFLKENDAIRYVNDRNKKSSGGYCFTVKSIKDTSPADKYWIKEFITS